MPFKKTRLRSKRGMNRLKMGSAELEIARIDLALWLSAISSPFWKIVFNEIARYRNKVTLSSWRHILKMLQLTTPLSEEDNPWPYISIMWNWRNSVQQCIYNIWLQRICYLKIYLLAGRHKLWVFLCSIIDAQRSLQWYTWKRIAFPREAEGQSTCRVASEGHLTLQQRYVWPRE